MWRPHCRGIGDDNSTLLHVALADCVEYNGQRNILKTNKTKQRIEACRLIRNGQQLSGQAKWLLHVSRTVQNENVKRSIEYNSIISANKSVFVLKKAEIILTKPKSNIEVCWCLLSAHYNLCSKFMIENKHGNAPKTCATTLLIGLFRNRDKSEYKATEWLKAQNYRSKARLLCGTELS